MKKLKKRTEPYEQEIKDIRKQIEDISCGERWTCTHVWGVGFYLTRTLKEGKRGNISYPDYDDWDEFFRSTTPDEKQIRRNQIIAFIGPANDQEKLKLSEKSDKLLLKECDEKGKDLKELTKVLINRQEECQEELKNIGIRRGSDDQKIIRKLDIVLHLKSLLDENVKLPIKYAHLTAEVHVTYPQNTVFVKTN